MDIRRTPFTKLEFCEIAQISVPQFDWAHSRGWISSSVHFVDRPTMNSGHHTALDIVEYCSFAALINMTIDRASFVASAEGWIIEEIEHCLDQVCDVYDGGDDPLIASIFSLSGQTGKTLRHSLEVVPQQYGSLWIICQTWGRVIAHCEAVLNYENSTASAGVIAAPATWSQCNAL